MIKIKNILIEHNLFEQIDIHFANYICKLASASDEQLWLLAAFISYRANQGDSAFSLDSINNRQLQDVFELANDCESEDDKEAENYDKLLSLKISELQEKHLLTYQEVIGSPGELVPIIFEDGLFYLNRFYQYELTVADFIKRRIKSYEDISITKDKLEELFPNNIIEKTSTINWQKVAAILALRSKFAVISGGPGTGKTTTVGKILALLLEQNPALLIKMVAPTGKAADRLNESIKKFKQLNGKKISKKVLAKIPENAETIHRFIGLNAYKLKYDKYRPAPIDLLLIDEASMVSLPIFAKTFEALAPSCQVILLGDKDQLMAVENGNVLKDITDSETLNSFSADFSAAVSLLSNNQIKLPIVPSARGLEDAAVQLQYSWRFKDTSGIGVLSSAVNLATVNTNMEELIELFAKYDDIDLKTITGSEHITKFIKEFCESHLNGYKEAIAKDDIREMLSELSKFRILCAVNNGPFGVNEINDLIETKLLSKEQTGSAFYHGRPIIITVNDYKLKLMNGDVGIIINNSAGELKAYFQRGEELVEFNPASLGEHKTAFAISIHKSQGSEFDQLFIILPDEGNRILSKELIYTAITRAKERCTIISTPDIFYQAVTTRIQRRSGLQNKLML